jgi:hypothetical protein
MALLDQVGGNAIFAECDADTPRKRIERKMVKFGHDGLPAGIDRI